MFVPGLGMASEQGAFFLEGGKEILQMGLREKAFITK